MNRQSAHFCPLTFLYEYTHKLVCQQEIRVKLGAIPPLYNHQIADNLKKNMKTH